MKKYDFNKMKELVKNNSANGMVSMQAGMYEDWSWTQEEVWNKEGGFSESVSEGYIAGIDGSAWATPVVKMYFEDGSVSIEDCYIEKNSNFTNEETTQMKKFARITGGMDSVE